MERTQMHYPDPPRNPRRVRAGVAELTVTGNDPTNPSLNRKIRKRLYIHTTKVMSHQLAQELRSRAHTLVQIEEATAS